MQRSTLKTALASILALLVFVGLGAIFWPATAQQSNGFKPTPTRVVPLTVTPLVLPSVTAKAAAGTSAPLLNETPPPLPSPPKINATITTTAVSTSTQAAETPSAPKPNDAPLIYTVKAGDNLFRLSVNYGVSLPALATANRLRTDAVLKVGQTLLIPGATVAASATPKPNTTGTATPITTPTPTKAADAPISSATPVSQVNGLPIQSFVVMPEAVKNNIRAIYAKGQNLGNNPRGFSKVGDSTIEPPHFLDRFDSGPYILGPYGALQPLINHYAGSFGRQSVAVKRGLSGWGLFDALWADRTLCAAEEGPLACELRLNKPSVVFIRIGSNDVSDPVAFEKVMRKVIEYCLERGSIPIIGTKADRFQDPNGGRNRVLRQLATEYAVPLWDFDVVAQTILGRGLESDEVHLTTYWLHDYSLSGAVQRGHGAHSITALIALDHVWREVK